MEFKDYKLNDEVSIGPYKFEVWASVSGNYFLQGLQCYGHEIFKHLGVEEHAYVMNIVGYECRGAFPEVQTLKDINKVIKQLQIDCLLKEAKEKYPVGTKYWPAHTGKCDGHFVVGDDQEIVFDGFYIYLKNPDGLYYSTTRNGNPCNQVLLYENEWAEITTEEPKQPEINTYGLKVGDTLKKDVISAWGMQGPNRYQSEENSGKWGKGVNFIGDRKIESFKVFNGIVGFLVSGTKKEVYLKAEGFKEFAESFDKPKFEVGKWYKCKGYTYTIKYLRAEANNSRLVIIYSDIIYGNKNYKSYPEGKAGVGYTDGVGWYKLTDLSEIQEYLPEGHPDKINQNKLIPGKWYKVKVGYEYIAKFVGIKNEDFVTPGYFIQNGKYTLNSPGLDNRLIHIGNRVFTEVPIEEVQQYLPSNHPDKIIKKKYTLKELINEEIIVYIDSQEEFDKITKAGKKIEGFESTSKYWGKYCYTFKNGKYSSSSSKADIGAFKTGCIIITIDDILIPEESINYVGRYIKILEDNPVGANVKKGEIFQVKRQGDYNIYYSEKEWTMNYTYNLGTLFELMPEDYSPERINPNTDFIFEPNGYYVGEWKQGVNKRVIFKTTTNKLSDPCYGIDAANHYQYSRTGFCNSGNNTFRKAHQDEIEWLDECIKQDKTVPYEKSITPKKSVNKWSAGTYVFIEKKVIDILVPELSIHEITLLKDDCIHIDGDCLSVEREEDGEIKWFATLEEAEAYKLKLIYTVPSVDPYETKQIDYDNSIDEQKQLNNIKDDKPIVDINKYQVDLSVKSALETNYKYFNNN